MTTVSPQTTGVHSKDFNVNSYATRKTISHGFLNVALLTANANQLKLSLQYGRDHPDIFFYIIIGLILASIFLQVLVGFLSIFLGSESINREARQSRMSFVNNLVTFLSFLISVINSIISGLGIGSYPLFMSNFTLDTSSDGTSTPSSET